MRTHVCTHTHSCTHRHIQTQRRTQTHKDAHHDAPVVTSTKFHMQACLSYRREQTVAANLCSTERYSAYNKKTYEYELTLHVVFTLDTMQACTHARTLTVMRIQLTRNTCLRPCVCSCVRRLIYLFSYNSSNACRHSEREWHTIAQCIS